MIEIMETSAFPEKQSRAEWLEFVNKTYGCLADDPIQRGEQGVHEACETIESNISLMRMPASNI